MFEPIIDPDQKPLKEEYYGVQFSDVGNDVILTGLPDPSTPPQVFIGPASCFNISKKPKTWAPRAAMMDAFGFTELVTLNSGATTIHDTDAEQQFLNPEYYKDHLSDEGVEKITLPTNNTYDDPADNQIPSPVYFKDHLSSEMIEALPVVPPPTDTTYDDHAQQMFERPGYQGVWSDQGLPTTNFIITPQGYDNDSDQQIPSPKWNLDYEEEHEGVPFIIVNTGAIQGWVYEENQIPTQPWYRDIWEGTETLIPITPPPITVIPVSIIKKVGITPRISFKCNVEDRFAVETLLVKARLTVKTVVASYNSGV